MAKISFTKLNKIKSMEPITITIGDQTVEVEQYLPLEKKLNMIENIVFSAGDGEEGFFNIVKLETYYIIEMINAYTNISFTDKQLEDVPKLYDAIRLNDVWAAIEDAIPEGEREYIWNNLLEIAREMTTYHNSALGIIRQLTSNQEDVSDIVNNLYEKIANPEQLQLVKRLLQQTGPINEM